MRARRGPDVVAPDADLAARLRTLPAAYVVEFVKRRRALGRDQAIAELDDLVQRVKLAGADPRPDDD